jgi:hypothetical protein
VRSVSIGAGHCEDHHPGAGCALARDEDDGDGRRQDHVGAVECGSQLAARGALAVAALDRPGLANGESDEKPDRVKRLSKRPAFDIIRAA